MNLIETDLSLRSCKKGSVTIAINNKITAGFPVVSNSLSGSVRLAQRLDHVIGFRVRYFNVSCASSEYARANGYLLALQSAALGSKVERSPFQFAISSDAVTTVDCNTISNVIGLLALSGTLNNSSLFDLLPGNRYLSFGRSQPIESFDYAITGINGNFNIAAAFAVEAVIEFFLECHC